MRLGELHRWMTENCRTDLPRSAIRPDWSDDPEDWADYEDDLEALGAADMSLTADAFWPVAAPMTGPVVHFTHDPSEVLSEGLHGVPDASRLGLTTNMAKNPDGFCFGYPARSDDAAAALDPQVFDDGDVGAGYGDTALVFKAEHILAGHRGDGDTQAIFEAASFDPARCVVMTRTDNPEDEDFPADERLEWCVSFPDGTAIDEGPLVWREAIDTAIRVLLPEPEGPSCG